ncbi:MAG: hypothetical protein KAJ91_02975 [Candidatus Aenigmarchaeota archaeon]|nr:hypothetical protein [Candidatus Aenigmarchaeota archaeon]
MSAKKESKKKTSVLEFVFGHKEVTRTDLIEMVIAAVFIVYLSFFVLKIHEII